AFRNSKRILDFARNDKSSVRPRFPAFADRLGVTVEVDVFHATDAFSNCIGGVFKSLFHSAKERPEKRQRKNAPINPVQGRFYFRLFFVATRSVLPPEVRRSQNHLRSDPSSIGSRLLDRSRWSKAFIHPARKSNCL